MKILIVNTHGIGDVVMSIPSIFKCHDLCFDICMLVKSAVEAEVIKSFCQPHEISVSFVLYKSFSKIGLRGYLNLLAEIRKLNADVMIPSFGTNQLLFNILGFASGIKVRYGTGGVGGFLNKGVIPFDGVFHKVEHNYRLLCKVISLLSNAKISFDRPEFKEFLCDDKVFNALRRDYLIPEGGYVCVSPGSGETENHKRWPISKYVQLIELLLDRGYSVIVVGGIAEAPLVNPIDKQVSGRRNYFNLVGSLSITETLNLLHHASCVVANCNGVSHLAVLANANIIGIYGPTNPALTGPYSIKFRKVSLSMSCSPCYRRGYITGCGKPVCMTDIAVEDVFGAVVGFIANE